MVPHTEILHFPILLLFLKKKKSKKNAVHALWQSELTIHLLKLDNF